MKTMAKLEGNIIEHMRRVIEVEEQQHKHFRYDSKLWRAVCDSIATNDGLVEHPEEHLIMCYRGTGQAISLKNVHLYPRDYTVYPALENKLFCMEVSVVYVHEDDTRYEPDTTSRQTILQVPTELAIKFNKTKFNNWVKKARTERESKKKEKDLLLLKELQEKYPKE